MKHRTLIKTYKVARRIVIGVIGGTVILLGVVLLFLPGPGIVVIPVGLAILGVEFAWARRWLRVVREQAQNFKDKAQAAKANFKKSKQDNGGP